jgi:hypothetical protein
MKEKPESKPVKRRGLKVAVYLVVLVVIAGGTWLVLKVLPLGMPDGEDYFKPIGERKLLKDEDGQWKYVMYQYDKLEYTGDTFGDWDESVQPLWKFAIAFTAYGMPSLALIDPENADMTQYVLWTMVKKMKSKKIWKDWIEVGFSEDPITYQNIMYKGHLNLMYGLYQLMSGDERFAREYTWLTRQIVDEMRKHHDIGRYDGTDCEPDRYFVQCNSIGLLSLHIYDKLYGTNYTENEVRWTLDFIHRRMVDPETGLYWFQYHPIHDNVERYLSGYTNAWAMVVLRPHDPEYNNKLYPVWKNVFVKEFGPYAYVKEYPDGGPSEMATGFGLWAAKEFGDVELFTKLRNSIDKAGELTWVPDRAMMMYRKGDNPLTNGFILSFKIHAGWNKILNHDWGYETPMEIPDVSDMTWKDVLPQEIHEIEYAPPPPAI